MPTLSILLLSLTPALAWPEEAAWSPLLRASVPLADPTGDWTAPAGDLLGDEEDPALAWGADASTLYLRLRVAADPATAPGTTAWGVLIETDGDPSTWDVSLAAGTDGAHLVLCRNTTPDGTGQAADPCDTVTWESDDALSQGWTRLEVTDDGTAWVDLAVDLALITDLVGPTTPLRLTAATASTDAPHALDADLAGHDGTTGSPVLTDGLSDPVILDEDQDGLALPAEEWTWSDPTDADTDDDGLLDGPEAALGTDPTDCDSDGDGLPDGLEAGLITVTEATDLESGCYTPDPDPSTTTDPALPDTDGGGLPDGIEDRDLDGALDPWETDPSDPADDLDADTDGIPDALEALCGGDLADCDGDTIPDAEDGLSDPDADGLPGFCDPDSDGDGLADGVEGTGDTDEDGIADLHDTDADGDGTLDAEEGTADPDGDGSPAFQDSLDEDGPLADPDGDGRPNGDEAACGTDPSDADSDDDGVTDGDDDCFLAGPDTGWTEEGRPLDKSCGCAVSPVEGSLLLPSLLCALALARRRRRRVAATLLAVPFGAADAAELGEGLDAQLFDPSPGETSFLQVPDSAIGPDGPSARILGNYAYRPLEVRTGTANADTLITHLATVDVQAAWTWRRARLGVDVPIHAATWADTIDGPSWLGDIAAEGRVVVLDRARHGFGGHVRLRGTLPSGNETMYLGEGRPTGEVGLGLAAGRDLVTTARASWATGSNAFLDDVYWSSRVRWGVAARLPMADVIAVTTEVTGTWLLANPDIPGSHPVEATLSLHPRLTRSLQLTAGAGAGLGRGQAAPRVRGLLGLAWTAPPRSPRPPRDTDADGLADTVDACAHEAEDRNGIEDGDGCPDGHLIPIAVSVRSSTNQDLPDAHVRVEGAGAAWDGVRREDHYYHRRTPAGPTRIAAGAPGHTWEVVTLEARSGFSPILSFRLPTLTSADQVAGDPSRARALVAATRPRTDGTEREPDRDADGVKDARDLCNDLPEDLNHVEDDDGCPEGLFQVVRILVRDPDGGPVGGARVHLWNGPFPGTWTADADGVLNRSLPHGTYKFSISTPDLLPAEREVAVRSGGHQEVTIILPRPNPVAGWEVSILDDQGRPLAGTVTFSGPVTFEVPAPAGRVSVDLPEGTFEIRASSPGYRSSRQSVEVRARRGTAVHRAQLRPLPARDATTTDALSRPVPFERGTLAMTAEAPALLQDLADHIRANPEWTRLSLEGHMVAPGPSADRDLYTFRLATEVRDWLIEHEGIPAARFACIGQGDRTPAPSSGTDTPDGPIAWVEVHPLVTVHEGPTVAPPDPAAP